MAILTHFAAPQMTETDLRLTHKEKLPVPWTGQVIKGVTKVLLTSRAAPSQQALRNLSRQRLSMHHVSFISYHSLERATNESQV